MEATNITFVLALILCSMAGILTTFKVRALERKVENLERKANRCSHGFADWDT